MKKTSKYQKSTFATNLIFERKRLGLTAEEFAEKAGIPYPTLRDLEVGRTRGRESTKEKIAHALNSTVDELNTPRERGVEVLGDHKADLLTRLYAIAPTLDESKLRSVVLTLERLAHGVAPDSSLISDKLNDKSK